MSSIFSNFKLYTWLYGRIFTNPDKKTQFFWNSLSVSLSSSSMETPFDKVGRGLTLMVALMSLTHAVWVCSFETCCMLQMCGSSTNTVQIECHCNWQGHSSYHNFLSILHTPYYAAVYLIQYLSLLASLNCLTWMEQIIFYLSLQKILLHL